MECKRWGCEARHSGDEICDQATGKRWALLVSFEKGTYNDSNISGKGDTGEWHKSKRTA